MNITTEDCPVIASHCDYYGYQCDNFGEVAISYCSHPGNPTETEGNCTHKLCPLTKKKPEFGDEEFDYGEWWHGWKRDIRP